MSGQDSTLLDAGILRIHALLDTSPQWSSNMEDGWHGLLSLADLLAISKDASTRELIESRIQDAKLLDVDTWGMKTTECIRARAGIVLFKLGYVGAAEQLYAMSRQTASEDVDTITLKHRIELAARLETIAPEHSETSGDVSKDDSQESGDRIATSENLFDLSTKEAEFEEEVSSFPDEHNLLINAQISLADPDRSLAVFEGLSDIWALFPKSAPEHDDRTTVLQQYGENLASLWTKNNKPLVSLVLLLDQLNQDTGSTLQNLVECTVSIPFELIVVLPDDSDTTLDPLLESFGALRLSKTPGESESSVLKNAVDECSSPYIAILTAEDHFNTGWLKAEFTAAIHPIISRERTRVVQKSEFDPNLFTLESDHKDMSSNHSTDSDHHPIPTSQSLADAITRADSFFKSGDYSNAEETLVSMQSVLNGHVEERVTFWTLLGDARFRQDKPDEAYQCYRKAVNDDPSAERAWIGIGTYHMIKDELEDARLIFTRILELNPVNQRGHLGLGNSYLKEERPADALPHFKEAVRLDPRYRHAVVGLVAAAVQAEKMEEAVQGLVRYLDEKPEDVEVRFHLAAIYFGTSQGDLAKDHAEQVIQANPEHTGAQQILAHLAGTPESG